MADPPSSRRRRCCTPTCAAARNGHFVLWKNWQGRTRTACVSSRRLASWVATRRAARRRQREHDRFKASLTGGAALDLLKQPLLPYHIDGVLHLAFRERALLADDMGLGKTVQAIAACALLRDLRGIDRVLVASPASLKAEWEEQIARFSELPACAITGNRLARRAAYRGRTFFTLCLDEAQRIKNWQTKTATRSSGCTAAMRSSLPAPRWRIASTSSTL